MRRLVTALPLIALLVLAVLFAGYSLRRKPQYSPDALVGQAMPALTLPSLVSGEPIPLDAVVKGPALVNYFASWCGPCIVEHPFLMAMKEKGVRIIGVAYKDEPAASLAFLARQGDPYAAVVVDREGRAGIDFGVTGPPETFVIGADGKILAKQTGPIENQAQADALVARLQGAR